MMLLTDHHLVGLVDRGWFKNLAEGCFNTLLFLGSSTNLSPKKSWSGPLCKIQVGLGHWPLSTGLGTGPEKTRFPECLVLPYTGTWFSSGFWYRADFWSPKSGRWRELFTLLDFRPKKQILVMTISTISMRQNRSISIFSIWRGGWGDRGVIITYIVI